MYPTPQNTLGELQIIHTYLAIKYGINLDPSLAAYRNAAGTVVWNNTTYWHDVFGIGKEDATSLDQSQSNSINTGSGDGTGQSGKGNIVLSSPSSLDDGDFLIIGHDNAPLNGQMADIPLGLGKVRLSREWKVKRTNDPGTVTLAFSTLDISVNGTSASDFILLIDEDGNGNFTDGTVTQVPASSYANNVATFNGVTLNDNVVFTIVTGTTGGPAITGAGLWLKGNTGVIPASGTLTAWSDQVGLNTFTVSGNPQTGNSAINFNNTVDFDGAGDFLTGDAPITFQTIYAVLKRNNADNEGTVISVSGPSNNAIQNVGYMMRGQEMWTGNNLVNPNSLYFGSTGNLGIEKARIGIVEILPGLSATESKTFIDGAFFSTKYIAGSGSTTATFIDTPYIGRAQYDPAPSYLNGQIAELIMYPASHTDAERKKIQSYLAIKYGITLDQSVANYISSAGTVLWDNTAYWHDVFGIGKDDASSLDQTQSNSINTGSGDGTGQSGKGNLVLSNPSSLDDGEFLMIGHDNAALAQQNSDLPPALCGYFRLTREWKADTTGNTGTVSLSFNLDGLSVTGTIADDFKLIVDEDGNGNFTSGTVAAFNADSVVDNIAYFSGITLADGAVFTFITDQPDLLQVICPTDPNLPACTPLADIQSAYTAWVNGFGFTGGVNTTDNIALLPTLPVDVVCNGAFISFTYIALSDCSSDTCTSTFTVMAPPVLNMLSPPNIDVVCTTPDPYATFAEFIAAGGSVAISPCLDTNTFAWEGDQQGDNMITRTYSIADQCGHVAYCQQFIYFRHIDVDTWVYLEGPMADTTDAVSYSLPMRTTLNDTRVLPGQCFEDFYQGLLYSAPGQPYSGTPWNYGGNEGDNFDSQGSLANGDAGYQSDIVDWVLLSLRDTLDGAPLCQKAALLHSNGSVEFPDGNGFDCCDLSHYASYYLVIEHRNHLAVMSDGPVTVDDGLIIYDFRNQQGYVDPNTPGAIGQKEVMPGTFAMAGGNGQHDSSVNTADKAYWKVQNDTISRYVNGDYNMNVDCNFIDRVIYEINDGKSSSVPLNY
jgi:hypothetical protein